MDLFETGSFDLNEITASDKEGLNLALESIELA